MLLIVSGRDDAGSTAPQFVTRIGGRIRALRKQRGWSVQRLAEAGTVSRRMLTQIELGQANPSLATVDRVARALDTDFAALALPSAEAEGGGAEGRSCGRPRTAATPSCWARPRSRGPSCGAGPWPPRAATTPSRTGPARRRSTTSSPGA
ncbi:helix-turn-helix domain-containing protein [Nocardiopsis composta]